MAVGPGLEGDVAVLCHVAVASKALFVGREHNLWEGEREEGARMHACRRESELADERRR